MKMNFGKTHFVYDIFLILNKQWLRSLSGNETFFYFKQNSDFEQKCRFELRLTIKLYLIITKKILHVFFKHINIIYRIYQYNGLKR